MPIQTIPLQIDDDFKEKVEQLGSWYSEHGMNVRDAQGNVSLSAIITQLIQEKLEEIEEEMSPEEEIEELKALYPQYVVDGVLDVEKIRQENIEGFRQGWHEAMTGQTRPIEELWAELEDED